MAVTGGESSKKVMTTSTLVPEVVLEERRSPPRPKVAVKTRTKYGLSRVSTKSFYTHHTQRISAAVLRYDAQNIREQSAQFIRRALLLDADAGAA
eukprot:7032609-Prymnesium_polylepis.1